MILNILGFSLTIMEAIALGSLLMGAIYGWYLIQYKVKSIEEDVKTMKIDGSRLGKAIDGMYEVLDNKLEPLRSQIRAQEQSQAAINATLISIQGQLQTVGNRLDTIISHMIISSKDK